MTPVAIVGHGCVLPGAQSPEELWDLVAERRSAIMPTDPGLWRIDPGADRTKLAAEIVSETGGYVRGFSFDPSGFAVPASELEGLDEVAVGRPIDRVAGDVAMGGQVEREAGGLVRLEQRPQALPGKRLELDRGGRGGRQERNSGRCIRCRGSAAGLRHVRRHSSRRKGGEASAAGPSATTAGSRNPNPLLPHEWTCPPT